MISSLQEYFHTKTQNILKYKRRLCQRRLLYWYILEAFLNTFLRLSCLLRIQNIYCLHHINQAKNIQQT